MVAENLRRGRPVLGAHLLLVYAFLYAPILMLIVLSFNDAGLPTVWGGFSTRWYGELFRNERLIDAAVNSLLVAGGATLLSTILGTLLAIGLARTVRSAVLDALALMPMIVPDIVLAIALLSFYTLLGWTLSLYSILLSHVVFNVAFVAAVVRTRLGYFDTALEEASMDLGANALKTFFTITLPLIAPGILAGALLAFTLSLDEFVIAFFTAGAGPAQQTLPIQVYSMVRFGVTPDVNALSTVILGISIALILVAQSFTDIRRII